MTYNPSTIYILSSNSIHDTDTFSYKDTYSYEQIECEKNHDSDTFSYKDKYSCNQSECEKNHDDSDTFSYKDKYSYNQSECEKIEIKKYKNITLMYRWMLNIFAL